ncbi:MAG: response regulator [Brevundimonas sp.]|nr:MAG: response regulator [Brevundimonas sp.]
MKDSTPTEIDPADQLMRLERRLARERTARLAAEAIAEDGMRELYRQQQRLRLVETIATTANLSDTPEAAFRMALDAICDFTGWTIGHVYMFADDVEGGDLIWAGVWNGGEDEALNAFRDASAAVSFAKGVGLPGRVWESGRACWIEDIAGDDNFPRAEAAAACGLRGAFAFPALIGEEVGAVMEFYLQRPAPPDANLLHTLDQVGAQLGRVIERYRHARRAQADHKALEAMYAEAELQRTAAEQANRAKSAFLAVTSHEIRTPLNAVLGLAEALRREPLTESQHELNDGVLASGAMLLRLLNAVLDMSRIEADQARARMEVFDLDAKLRSIISIWTPRAGETGVALDLEVVADDQSPWVRSDVGRIEQTLVNLISNALKFTPEGGRVSVRALLDEGALRLEVLDDGPGVPAADQERIFQPFEQTEAGREAGGAGLGLAICAGNIRLLGGDIGVDRAADGRNRFWITCPVEAGVADAKSDIEKESGPTTGLRVLAAEDNPANRRVLEVLLAPSGVDLTFAENGAIALEIATTQAFDLILMDVNMPEMDGVQALEQIRAVGGERGEVPVYMLTANAFADDVERYLAMGADGVLTKPIDLPRLYEVLSQCFAARPSSPEVAAA